MAVDFLHVRNRWRAVVDTVVLFRLEQSFGASKHHSGGEEVHRVSFRDASERKGA